MVRIFPESSPIILSQFQSLDSLFMAKGGSLSRYWNLVVAEHIWNVIVFQSYPKFEQIESYEQTYPIKDKT